MRIAKVSLIVFLCLTIAGAVVVVNDLRYPPEWDQIHLGMPRSEVESLIGPDPGEMVGLGSAYWSHRGLLVRNQLRLYMDPYDGVSSIQIQHLSIFPGEHQLWNVSNEHLPAERHSKATRFAF